MNITINNKSKQPIYEQIKNQIKEGIIKNNIDEKTPLPSIRKLSKDIETSVMTVKKAYDNLEEEGLVVTVHGKGSFIAAANQELLMEERRKELEKELEAAVQKARTGGLTAKEIRESFEIIMEDEVC